MYEQKEVRPPAGPVSPVRGHKDTPCRGGKDNLYSPFISSEEELYIRGVRRPAAYWHLSGAARYEYRKPPLLELIFNVVMCMMRLFGVLSSRCDVHSDEVYTVH